MSPRVFSRYRSWLGVLLVLLTGLALLALGAEWVGNFIEDDTLISLRYAERFASGHGLTWNDGERVEGYSNLSWVVLVAALMRMGIDGILAVRIWSGLSFLLVFLSLGLAAHRLKVALGVSLLVAIALGTTYTLPVWMMGALEQPLVVACLSVGVLCLIELHVRGSAASRFAPRLAAFTLSILVWTRPDSPLLVAPLALGAAAVGEGLCWRQRLQRFSWFALVPLGAFLLQLGFRLYYYGQWVPNTALIKTHLTPERLKEGWDYIARGLHAGWFVFGLGTVGAAAGLLDAKTRKPVVVLLGMACLWIYYVARIGGDHFPAYRHLMVAQVLAAFLVLLGGSVWLQNTHRWAKAISIALVGIGVGAAMQSVEKQRADVHIHVARIARWQWDGRAVGEMFRDTVGTSKPLWAVTAAGCLPYFSGLPALDLLGLNDAHIARVPPDPRLPLAHDHGDGEYVLARQPDLITFGLPGGGPPIFKSGAEMARKAAFQKNYQLVTFRTLGSESVLSRTYVRRDGKIGIVKESDAQGIVRLNVPGYLLTGALGLPQPDGGLGAVIYSGKQSSIDLPALSAGTYRVSLEPSSPQVEIKASVRGRDAAVVSSDEDGSFVLQQEARLRLSIGAKNADVLIATVRLERTGLQSSAPSVEPDIDPVAAKSKAARAEVIIKSAQRRGRHPKKRALQLHNLKDRGLAFVGSPAPGPRRGQGSILGQAGPYWNSFLPPNDSFDGDLAHGRAQSDPFQPEPGMLLQFHIAGARASEVISQAGVRLLEETPKGPKAVMVWGGEGDEILRLISFDLTALAGRTLRLELFDEAEGSYGHVIVAAPILVPAGK